MTNATLIQLFIFGWAATSFGADPFQGQETISALEEQEVVIPEASYPEVNSEAALEHYRQYLAIPDGDPEMRLEAMRRMGDLNIREGENAQFYDPAYVAEMAFHSDAIQLYEQLLLNQDGYEKTDLVLYQLARAYESIGAPKKALIALNRMVNEYPQSQYIHEAQFRRGEILFAYKEYYEAGLAYHAVVEHGKDSAYYEQSMYKEGWSFFKQGEYDLTVNAFLDLLNLRLAAAQVRPELVFPDGENFANNPARLAEIFTHDAISLQAKFDSMNRPERELVDDTLRALSLTFSYMNGAESINEYVDKRGGVDPAYLLYISLGDLYLEKERYLDAAETFDVFVASEPLLYSAPQLSMRSIEAYKLGRFPSKVLEGKRNFVESYGLESDYWSFHDPVVRQDVIQLLKVNLSDLAQYDHAEAQRTDDRAAYIRAADWYRRYLSYFPNDPEAAERSFLLGEVLMESAQFTEAIYYYQKAAYDYPEYEKASEAGYAGLLAARANHASLEGEEADAWLGLQLRQALNFSMSFPDHEQAAPVLGDTAEAYFANNEMDEAIVISGELLTRDLSVSPELQQVGWTVVAHGHFDLEHYRRAEISYLQLRSMGGAGSMTAEELDERIAASVYRQAEVAQLAGEVDLAVYHYLRVAVVAPDSSITPNAIYDAGVLLFNESRWQEAITIMIGFRSAYPEHEFANRITQNLAIAYQRSEQPVKAAHEYENIAVFSEVDEEVRREALWTAAELYEESGEIKDARRVWRQYVDSFPNPVGEAIEIRQRLADLAGEVGDARDRRDWLAAIISADASAGNQRNDRTKTLAARATLELADPKREAFNAVRLNIPLAESMKHKKQLMESALKAYNEAAGYEITEIKTVATFRIAQLYQQLSADLMESERPAGLSVEELDQYEILLEEQTFPFEEKAIEIFEVNVNRASNGIYDEWVADSYKQLAILMPARYAKFEKADKHVVQLY
ncbi:MAG: tetratricopeptide repeat protein [Gammaproteobacteria bacterium]|nr:tetratricopeptide repeat protein [Gammaproteobacteria bacterium]MCP4090088.1 tetratricopeptide repeat protein [Gammaproteobacteria bacterium]MCP4277022.1 tetratricopeptide repeat protein [Gammaproteobacteria bacterium]MCP4832755.1 tetratricopeptide repeat protein [Gammaproteobacteria bacterium]MCP4929948.1 tetratricopeptide repeat protein [Gammaproteobacteria bacterium]